MDTKELYNIYWHLRLVKNLTAQHPQTAPVWDHIENALDELERITTAEEEQ